MGWRKIGGCWVSEQSPLSNSSAAAPAPALAQRTPTETDNDGEQRLAKLRAAATPAGKAYSEGLARRNEKNWPGAIAALRRCVALDADHSRA